MIFAHSRLNNYFGGGEKMKNFRMAIIAGVLVALIITPSLFAEKKSSKNYLTISFFINPFHAGYKHMIKENIYAVGNIDYIRAESDLQFQFGAVYMLPKKIWFFRMYGGGGFQFSRNQEYQFPYLSLGSSVWIFFWEINHPLRARTSPDYRFGLVFKI